MAVENLKTPVPTVVQPETTTTIAAPVTLVPEINVPVPERPRRSPAIEQFIVNAEQHKLIDVNTIQENSGVVTVLVNTPEVNGQTGGQTRVSIKIAIQISDMYTAAAADGIRLEGGGYRTRAQ